MSVSQIPNLPAATSLGGSEQLEAVQAGTSVRVTAAQIAAYTQAQYPVSTITSVTAASPLQSTTVGNAVTISLPLGSVTYNYLAPMPDNTLLGNFTGGSSSPVSTTVTAALDSIGSAQGGMLYRGASAWQQLGAGPIGYVLTGAGAGGTPYWQNLSLGSMATQNANNVAITGGAISGVAISSSTINQTPIGASTPSTGAFTTLSANSTASFATISSGVWQGTAVAVAYGGTGATDATNARLNLGAAKSGANSDITSLLGLTTPLSAPQGGTGFGSYTTGDLLYADSSTTLARLNDVATGNALISGGVGVAPSWGKIGLTTHVTGTLPVASGGTGQSSSLTQYGVIYGSATNAMASTSAGTTGQILTANTGGAPTWSSGSITIGSTNIALGGTATTISGLTTLTLTQDPTAALQASTKQYVDTQVATVSNQTFHTASDYGTTAALTANYSNGTGGVGATLTNSGALAALDIDGHTFTATDVTNGVRVLVKNQSSAFQNGIYVVSNEGSGSVAWVLTRAADFNTVGTGPNYIQTGSATFVTSGSVNASTGWVMTTSGTITVGSTALTWAQTSSSSSVTVTAPLNKVGSVIGLNTVTVPFGGTGLTSLTQYGVMIGNGTGNVAFASPGTSGYALLSNGASANPSFGQLSLTSGVTGTLPVANGGTGASTAFTAGSVVFAGASGVYSQDNAKFFWDDTNNRLGINSASPNANMTIVSNTQAAAPPSAGSLPAGTDLYIMGADAANTRITQDAYGTGNYAAYTGRQARGTAASPTASQTGDILVEVTGRGYGATGFASSSTVRIDMEAAEAFTDTAQGTYISFHTSALGTASAVEKFRIGPSGQWGIGGATYGTSGYVFTSGGASAAPTWSQVSASSLTGILPVANGGTGLASWTTGSLVYASGTTTLAGLADVATGNVLLSGGVGVAPAWGQVSLTTAVTGTLPIANGGTGLATTPANGALDIGNGTGFTRTTLTQGTNIAITNGAGSISIATSATPSFATSVTTPLVIGGTAASSSLTLQSTSGVGTSDSILFKVGNNGATTAMTIDTLGSVGIGTSSPAVKLDVRSSSSVLANFSGNNANNYVQMSDNSGTNWASFGSIAGGNWYLYTAGYGALYTGGTERMRIDSSGNVGIGTSSPSAKLDVGGGTGLQVIRVNGASSGTSAGSAVYFGQGGSTNIAIGNYSAIIGGAYDATAYVYSNGALGIKTGGGTGYNMYMDVNGFLGIGTTSPGSIAKLTVANTSTADNQRMGVAGSTYFSTPSYTATFISQGDTATTGTTCGLSNVNLGALYFQNTSAALIYTNGGSPLVFGTSGTERMRIDASGNVGIGTSSPSSKLEVVGASPLVKSTASSGYGAFYANAATGNGAFYFFAVNNTETARIYSDSANYIGFATGSSGTEKMRIDSSGNVGIGTGSPSYPITVSRSGVNTYLYQYDGTGAMVTGSNGSGLGVSGTFSNTAMAFFANSAERMRIDTSGNLNIATSGVSAKLYVNGNSASNIYALTDGATITPDFSTGNNFSVTLAGNRTLANPTNMTVGQSGIVYITQDGTGSRTLAYGAYWKFPSGTAPTLTTTASATDALVYTVRTSTSITVTAILNIG